MRLDDAGDLPRVARHLERDIVMHAKAPREQLERLGLGLDAARRAQLAILDERHLAKVAVNVQRHSSQRLPPIVMDSRVENRWVNDIDGSALAAQPGKSQGQPLKSSGSNTHRPKTAYPTCVLPEGP